MPFMLGTVVYATEDRSVQNQPLTRLRSIIPMSDNQLNAIEVNRLSKKKLAVTPINNPPVFLENGVTYGGGYGGNEQTGVLIYDGRPYNLGALTISRDDKNKRCFLENQIAGIYHHYFWSLKLVSYECAATNKNHNEVYWNERFDKQNGGYSPDNDALYASFLVNSMYEQWFGISVSQNADGSPLPIKIVTHNSVSNAYVGDNDLIVLGNGGKQFYPFTSPGVVSFVMALVFTKQHARLDYSQYSQSGAIDYAFAAMADQALKFYINGEVDWQLAGEISKTSQPFFYVDQPSKECGSRVPGDGCSIDHMSQYNTTIINEYASGIYRRAFYLLATTSNWNVKKAFSVMVQANRFYWTQNQGFSEGVCGIIKAARDFQYDESAVIDAFNQVGVSSDSC